MLSYKSFFLIYNKLKYTDNILNISFFKINKEKIKIEYTNNFKKSFYLIFINLIIDSKKNSYYRY